MSLGNPNLSLQPAGLPALTRQFLDFGSEQRFNRLLAIYRRGSTVFASTAALEELCQLLEPQLEDSRVCNDFEWKTLLLFSAAAFQAGDAGLRRRIAQCAEENAGRSATPWSRMCRLACSAQLRPALMPELEEFIPDLELLGYSAAVMLCQAAYSHNHQTLLSRAISRITLYEEALSFPGSPKVQYYLGLAMQQILGRACIDEFELLEMSWQLEHEPEQAAFRIGLDALRTFSPLPPEERPAPLRRESAG